MSDQRLKADCGVTRIDGESEFLLNNPAEAQL
jgi:hypothetical protein